MGPCPNLLLVLVLCLGLGQAVHTQGGVLPTPCIRAELGPVNRRGRPVTIVCWGPAGAELFRLEDKNGRLVHGDQRNVSQRGPQWTEARFHIDAVSEDMARGYHCLYQKRSIWSDRSEILELKVTDKGVFPLPSGAPRVITCTPLTPTKPPSIAGVLPTPSIRAEPGPVVPRGRPVTIVCQSPAWAEVFRLEDNNSSVYGDQTVTVPHVFNGTEARFHINAVSEDTAKSYRCLYRKGSAWSESSDILELKVADEDVSPPPTETTSEVTAPPTGVGSQNCPASQNPTVGNYVCIGLSGVVLVILLGILAEAWHSRHWSPQEAQG